MIWFLHLLAQVDPSPSPSPTSSPSPQQVELVLSADLGQMIACLLKAVIFHTFCTVLTLMFRGW